METQTRAEQIKYYTDQGYSPEQAARHVDGTWPAAPVMVAAVPDVPAHKAPGAQVGQSAIRQWARDNLAMLKANKIVLRTWKVPARGSLPAAVVEYYQAQHAAAS